MPLAPLSVSAVRGENSAVVSFLPPVFDGGLPILRYLVTSPNTTRNATGTSSPITVTGLTNGDAFSFRVQAINAVGLGHFSARSNGCVPGACLASICCLTESSQRASQARR